MTAWQEQRQLHGIEAELAASAPRLAGMLRMFSRLTEGERPSGMERLSRRARPQRDFPRQPGFVSVLVLTAAVVSGVLLAVLTHPGPRQCRGVAVTRQASTASVAEMPAGGSAAGTAKAYQGVSASRSGAGFWLLVPAGAGCPVYSTKR